MFPLEAEATTTASSRKASRPHFLEQQYKGAKEELDNNIKAKML